MEIRFERYKYNPIISPSTDWETQGTFNPTAFMYRNKVFIVYRQISRNNISTLGLAISDGYEILDRLEEPIYIPRAPFEIHPDAHNKINTFLKIDPSRINWKYVSGESYFGVEDPRICLLGDNLVLTYVAFNGVEPPRSAMSTIRLKDFLNERWDKWSKPVIITHPEIPDKSVVLFPKRINNKLLFFHRIFPFIWADYVNDLSEFHNGRFLFGRPVIFTRPDKWDSRKVGAGSTPMETEFGWLLVYHAVSGWDEWYRSMNLRPEDFKVNDGYRYKAGLMVLEKDNPEKVFLRSDVPALEPETWYELYPRAKPNVIYPTGAVIIKDKLLVYYGASDFFVCLAEFDLNILKEIIEKYAEEGDRKPIVISETGKLVGGGSSSKPKRSKARRKIHNALQSHYIKTPKRYKRLHQYIRYRHRRKRRWGKLRK